MKFVFEKRHNLYETFAINRQHIRLQTEPFS